MVFVVLAIIAVAHVVFSFLTDIHTTSFFHVLNPAMYVGLWLLLRAIGGRNNRPMPKGQHALIIAGFGISIYITLLALLGVFFGFARNAQVLNMTMFLNNLWMFAPFAMVSEFLRHQIIRDSYVNKKPLLISLVTGVFIFTQINAFPTMDTFVTVIAPIITLNSILSYVAKDGPLSALLLLRGVFSLSPVLLPMVPAVPHEVWAIFLQVILFTILALYQKFMPEDEKRRRELKESLLQRFALPAATIALLIFFNMGWFPVFPSVILTDSMEGALDRGSVALVRRTFDEIEEGDIIQFRVGNVTVIHRVVEIHSDLFGEPYFITQGDANDRPDSAPVKREQVNGVVFGSLSHLGMVRVWINQMFM